MTAEISVDSIRTPPIVLRPADIPIDTPIDWPLVDMRGATLFDAGTRFPDEAARAFLFRHFEPYRPAADHANAPISNESAPSAPITLDDIGLKIGARLGLRALVGASTNMYSSRVIGFSSARVNAPRALFITQPLMAGHDPLELTRGEQVDLVALSSRAVVRFACTVDMVCREPFPYVVLSEPGLIRKLRARKFARMDTRLAARFGREGSAPTEIGRICDISPFGMSLAVIAANAKMGDRLRVAFHFETDGIAVHIDTRAVVRHVTQSDAAHRNAAYGLEFELLEPSQRIALKSFMADSV